MRLLLLLLSLGAMHAYATERIPYSDAGVLQTLNEDEKRVWSASVDFEHAIDKSGQIYPSTQIEQYMQKIMDKLYPEFIGVIKVRAINSPQLNAFAIPNGNIYMNTGLLVRCENEAQLATVLAHEGAHFVYRHGYYQQQSVKNASGFATITAVLGVPIVGLVGGLIANNAVYGYSRELETEADNMGFQRLVKAGYDVSEASRVFEHLAQEVKLSDVEEKSFYATHPKLKDRIENFTKLASKVGTQGEKNEQVFSDVVSKARQDDLDAELSFGRYKHLIAMLQNPKTQQHYDLTWTYYLGEAYRKRNEKDDADFAMRYLNQAIQLMPDFAPSYRAKGLLLMQQAKNNDAEEMLKKYLELSPKAPDRSYVESYLETLKKPID